MSDSKVTALSTLSALTGDETLYIIEDDDGTPASRQITIEDFLTAIAGRTELTGAFVTLLKQTSVHYAVGDKSGNHTTTSSSYADVAAQYSLSVPAVAGDRLEIELTCTAFHSSATASMRFTSSIGGSDLTVGVVEPDIAVANEAFVVTYRAFYVVQSGDISGGNVACKPRWRTSASTATMLNENTTHRSPVFSVKNWKQ